MGGFLRTDSQITTAGFFGGAVSSAGGSFSIDLFVGPSSAPGQYTALPTTPEGFGFGGIPCGAWDDWAPPFSPLLSDFQPDPSLINGSQVLVCSYLSGPPPGFSTNSTFCVCIHGTLPQNFFNSISVELIPETFNQSGVAIFDSVTYAAEQFTLWLWPSDTNVFLIFGTSVVSWN